MAQQHRKKLWKGRKYLLKWTSEAEKPKKAEKRVSNSFHFLFLHSHILSNVCCVVVLAFSRLLIKKIIFLVFHSFCRLKCWTSFVVSDEKDQNRVVEMRVKGKIVCWFSTLSIQISPLTPTLTTQMNFHSLVDMRRRRRVSRLSFLVNKHLIMLIERRASSKAKAFFSP